MSRPGSLSPSPSPVAIVWLTISHLIDDVIKGNKGIKKKGIKKKGKNDNSSSSSNNNNNNNNNK